MTHSSLVSPAQPSVSIIVVTYNGREHLERLLPSLEELDYPKEQLEILCVDNGSRDGTVEMLESRFPKVRLLRNSRNEGFAAPNNQAARLARGEILALVNNDMRVERGWLREGLAPLLEDSETAAVGCRILSWDGEQIDFAGGTLNFLGFAVHPDLGKPISAGPSSDGFPDVLFACGGAMLIRRSVFLGSGGFDEDFFAVLEDVDLGWRLRLMGHKVRLAPRSIVYHRRHGTLNRAGQEKHRFLLLRNALCMAIKNYSEATLSQVLPALLALALRRVVEGAHIQRENFYFWSDQSFPESFELKRQQFLDAMTEAVALDEVLGRFAHWSSKRAETQARRVVPDERILSLFQDPFRMIWKEAGTLGFEEALENRLGLERLFQSAWPEGGERRVRLERYETELAGRIRHREGELELMSLRLDLCKRALESYLEDLRQGQPLDPRLSTRRALPFLQKLGRKLWLLRFYWRFEGFGGLWRRLRSKLFNR